jgi:hypothetical protein
METWVTSLDLSGDKLFNLYCEHATAEQYHAEIKSELDLERMPSGALFKTNALVLGLGMLAYNVLLAITGRPREHDLQSPFRAGRDEIQRRLETLKTERFQHQHWKPTVSAAAPPARPGETLAPEAFAFPRNQPTFG